MNEKENFEDAWRNHFPQEKAPTLACFLASLDHLPSERQDGEKPAIQVEVVQKSLDDQKRQLDDLVWQLERQRFVVDHLTGLLARLQHDHTRAENVKLRELKRHDNQQPPAPKPKPRPLVMKRTDAAKVSTDPESAIVDPVYATEERAATGATKESVGLVKRGSLPHITRPDIAQLSNPIERSYSERPANGRKTVLGSSVTRDPGDVPAVDVTVADSAVPKVLASEIKSPAPTNELGASRCAILEFKTFGGGSGNSRGSIKDVSTDMPIGARAPSHTRKGSSNRSDYVELWVQPSVDKQEKIEAREKQTEAANSELKDDGGQRDRSVNDDSSGSAASIGSGGGDSLKRGASRSGPGGNLVLIQYNDGVPAPTPNENQGPTQEAAAAGDDSDVEDEPNYVRLVYKALSTVKLAGLSGSTGNLSVESGSSDLEDTIDSQDIAEQEQEITPAAKDEQPLSRPEGGPERSYSSEGEKLRMRNWVVTSILESERFYVDDLDVILSYKKNLEFAAKTSQPLISMHDIEAIFCNIGKIHEAHQQFLTELTPVVSKWSPRSEVGSQFKFLAANMPIYETYVNNWPNAIATLKRCCQENLRFQDLVSVIKCKSPPADRLSLEEILHKPINRVQRNTMVLHDLIQCTPLSHPDYGLLQRSLSLTHYFLAQLKVNTVGTESRFLVKNRLLVEHVATKFRRLRHVFLFNDVIICTKPKINRQKCQFEVKWHLPLSELVLSDTLDDRPVEWRQRSDKAEKEIAQMKARVRNLKAELRREMKDTREKSSTATAAATAAMAEAAAGNVKAERIKRKLEEEEAALVLAEPRLRFSFESRAGQKHSFLMSSDYERNEWHESIASLIAKASVNAAPKMTTVDAQNAIDSCKDNVKLNSVSANLLREAMDQDIVSGQMNVTIHKLQGLLSQCNTYCVIEVDSFGHFYTKAKTHVLADSVAPEWNEEFELDLEAATTLRIICYKHTSSGDILLGKSALDLSKSWLRQGFDQKGISMNEVTLTVSIRYRTADQTIQRIPSRVSTGVYGVKLSSTVRKEGTLVPVIVTACIKEVEKRGYDEVGIYRVSGMTSDVQRIKKAFDKTSKAGLMLLEEVDIHAVTGALKLYFRELPEALFTDELYPCLLDGMNLSEPEAKEKCMVSLICSLPDPNYHTVMAMLAHLIKICSHEVLNKMPHQNMATVFGPTLLKPAQKPSGDNTVVTFSSGASDALYQTGILYYYLTLVAKGSKFR